MAFDQSVGSAVELGVTVVIALRMVWVGFLRPPGRVLSWPMFSRGCSVIIDLTGRRDGVYEKINIFDHLPASHFAITSTELQWIVEFLSQRYEDINGEGVILYSDGEFPVHVKDGHVVV